MRSTYNIHFVALKFYRRLAPVTVRENWQNPFTFREDGKHIRNTYCNSIREDDDVLYSSKKEL